MSINTVTKLLLDAGAACEAYQDQALKNLKCRRIQCYEIRAFVYAKAKNLPEKLTSATIPSFSGLSRSNRVLLRREYHYPKTVMLGSARGT